MKPINPSINKSTIGFLVISLFLVMNSTDSNAQYPGIEESIAKYRKGELLIQAKRGSQVTIEQMSHEFWFGCAIPNSLARGMSQNDLTQFKEKFLENFNSAVTENALKWAIMEPRKDQEN